MEISSSVVPNSIPIEVHNDKDQSSEQEESEEDELDYDSDEACRTWRVGKQIGLSTSNDQLAIQAFIEDRRNQKSDKKRDSRNNGRGKLTQS